MVDYWGDLMNYEGYQASKKMVGPSTSEQIQEDIRCYIHSQPYGDESEELIDDLCQIVVDNFKHNADENEIITEGDKKLKTYLEREEFFEDTNDLTSN